MRKLAWIVLASAVTACGAPADAPSASDPSQASSSAHVAVPLTPSQAQGQVIFETMCWTCHGPAGRGDGPAVRASAVTAPPSFHSAEYEGIDPSTLERRFLGSLDGTDERHAHMQYVASLLVPERFADALAFIPALTYPEELPGSALGGQAIYEFRCQGCHGTTGRGDGTAAGSLIAAKPADFTVDTLLANRSWDALYARIDDGGQSVHGSSMPPWGVVLTPDEIWDLISYLATFQPDLLASPSWIE